MCGISRQCTPPRTAPLVHVCIWAPSSELHVPVETSRAPTCPDDPDLWEQLLTEGLQVTGLSRAGGAE